MCVCVCVCVLFVNNLVGVIKGSWQCTFGINRGSDMFRGKTPLACFRLWPKCTFDFVAGRRGVRWADCHRMSFLTRFSIGEPS